MSEKAPKRLRCYALPSKGGVWVAKCVDLEVATQGNSLEDARASLDEAVTLYLEVAMNDCTPEVARALLNRRSSLYDRLLWKVLYWNSHLGYHAGRMTAFLADWPKVRHHGQAPASC